MYWTVLGAPLRLGSCHPWETPTSMQLVGFLDVRHFLHQPMIHVSLGISSWGPCSGCIFPLRLWLWHSLIHIFPLSNAHRGSECWISEASMFYAEFSCLNISIVPAGTWWSVMWLYSRWTLFQVRWLLGICRDSIRLWITLLHLHHDSCCLVG